MGNVINVSTVQEFLDLGGVIQSGDTVNINADLDFGGRIFGATVLTVNYACTFDFQNHSMTGLVIRSIATAGVGVVDTGGSALPVTYKNLNQLDVDIEADDSSVFILSTSANGDLENVRITARVICKTFASLGYGVRDVSDCAFLVNVSARDKAYAVAESVTSVRRTSVGGRLQSDTADVFGVSERGTLAASVATNTILSAGGSGYAFGVGNFTNARDITVGGVIKTTTGIGVGVGNGPALGGTTGSIRRAIVRADFKCAGAFGVRALGNSYCMVRDCLVTGKFETVGACNVVTQDSDSQFGYNNFYVESVTINGNPPQMDTVRNGTEISAETAEDIQFYRDVLGFDI